MPDAYLARLLDYNNWANRGVLAFLRAQPPELLDATAVGVFGTVRETLEHVLSSELGYYRHLSRLGRGEFTRPERPDIDVLDALADEAADNWSRLAGGLPPGDEMLPTRDGPRSAATVFTQLLVHGIEHRGHVWTVLSANGIKGLELDGWAHGIFAHGDAWPPAPEWGPEPSQRAEFPTLEQS
jgi:uncharacterized damage-inducible protein DinB